MYRHPRTTQEQRENGKRCHVIWIDDYPIKIRPSRSMSHLPTCWDDIYRNDVRDRSWKKYRKTQYRTTDK